MEEIGSCLCKQYQTTAHFFIETTENGMRHLAVKYADGRKDFRALIPAEKSQQDVLNLLLNDPNLHSDYPVWEHGARLFGDFRLRWPISTPTTTGLAPKQ